jgi:hypothetical protein
LERDNSLREGGGKEARRKPEEAEKVERGGWRGKEINERMGWYGRKKRAGEKNYRNCRKRDPGGKRRKEKRKRDGRVVAKRRLVKGRLDRREV